MMSAIRSRDTAPEMLVRRFLHARGWRFRVCDKRFTGRPDIVVPRARAIIEIRGCFWHRHGWEWDGRKLIWTAFCPEATTPKSNRAFWNAKFRANVRRDAAHEALWRADGWGMIVLWTCGLGEKRRSPTLAWLSRTLAAWEARCGG